MEVSILDNILLWVFGLPIILIMIGRIFGGIALFTHGLPKRPRTGLRYAAIIGICFGVYVVVACLYFVILDCFGEISTTAGYLLQFVFFSLVLLACTGFVLFVYDTTVWTALFCTTAGYSIQNLCSGTSELLGSICSTLGLDASSSPLYWINALLPVAVIFPLCYVLLARKINAKGLGQIEEHSMALMMPVVSLVIIGFDLVVKAMTEEGLGFFYVVVLRAMHGLTCVYTLWMEYELLYRKHLEIEKATTERVMEERERQYQQSRNNIDAINIKCHDIKYQIRNLSDEAGVVSSEALSDLERTLEIYDTTMETENEALDTILTEKSLLCHQHGIQLTCLADGRALGFMSSADIYSFFGNALDNAIRAVCDLDDSQRSISLVVREVSGMVSIHIENPCNRAPEFVDGLPQTTKTNREEHGYGVRSMRNTVEHYGGILTTFVRDGTFHVNAMIPVEQ